MVILIFVIRGCTLPGAVKGIKFYVIPKFDRLVDAKVSKFALFFFIMDMLMFWLLDPNGAGTDGTNSVGVGGDKSFINITETSYM